MPDRPALAPSPPPAPRAGRGGSRRPAAGAGRDYVIGVMTMDVEGKDSAPFRRLVEAATRALDRDISQALGVRVDLLAFEGPHLTPAAGAYAPLDFLQIGMTEKLERGVHFLLIVTEVDLAASTLSYTLALPSQLTNVGVVSTKRLAPSFWGDDPDEGLAERRLTSLLLHTFGHLLNLNHAPSPTNVMYDFAGVDDLDGMDSFTESQRAHMRRALPREAHERTSTHRVRFTLETLVRDWRSIAAAVARANPFRLVTRLPTMITAALSVLILLFFTPDMWDVASTVELYQLVAFSVVAVAGSTIVLYRAFAFGGVLGRGRRLAESTVVTSAATALCLALTMALLFAIFAGSTYLGVVTVFPRKLMETWPTVDPAVRPIDHVKLSLFVAALGVLAGSLGGRADSADLVRGVLFVDEET
ncbi:hypothetical protein RQM47_04210 [Rubrivirga sp. S365]|uniref:Uncharacterized protein n=1 Tax=Rubrivirga litoralis TaxID=3075598 RepID=A0ABU3BM14_9BACT|nr:MULTISPECIES: hypothetical protein [unclassified Rubrivirga]MDT0630326.1 hypothetical protein [Rubrivirga sp. F394]MDT7855838.1 hypothetical protein [Rubrivirga sp. S365]